MPSIEVLVAFTIASLLMNLSPGPSNLYVMARSLAQGARGGMVAAAGLAVGSLLHVAAAVLGLAALFAYSPLLYTGVKLLGAFYLLWLGYRYWVTAPARAGEQCVTASPKSSWTIFAESILVEVTNPKTALFFIAFLPQFVVPEAGPVALQLLILGAIVTLSGLPCDLLVALSSSRVARWLLASGQAQRLQQRLSGSILAGMGGWIVAAELRDGWAR